VLALILLIALFLARRFGMTPKAHQISVGVGQSASAQGSNENLTPADRQSLDQTIRDKAHP
jgi:hypothetical protein